MERHPQSLGPLTDLRVSVVIPVYNEADTVARVIDGLRKLGVAAEIIVVDDGSTDGTAEALRPYSDTRDIVVLKHEKNCGKGAALRTGVAASTGNVVIIQDADLEYFPSELARLVDAMASRTTHVVYGSRFLSGCGQKMTFLQYLANRLLTRLVRIVTRHKVTDVETCMKGMDGGLARAVFPSLRENRFGIEIELTMKLLLIPSIRFAEVPVEYSPRNKAAGKKIRWKDGLWALWCIARYSLLHGSGRAPFEPARLP